MACLFVDIAAECFSFFWHTVHHRFQEGDQRAFADGRQLYGQFHILKSAVSFSSRHGVTYSLCFISHFGCRCSDVVRSEQVSAGARVCRVEQSRLGPQHIWHLELLWPCGPQKRETRGHFVTKGCIRARQSSFKWFYAARSQTSRCGIVLDVGLDLIPFVIRIKLYNCTVVYSCAAVHWKLYLHSLLYELLACQSYTSTSLSLLHSTINNNTWVDSIHFCERVWKSIWVRKHKCDQIYCFPYLLHVICVGYWLFEYQL